uniref:Uncharacterized protein n=1 Tax=Geospiza parvula TaxID=87175 RepID=A0A8U8CIW0_GEOPR
HNIPHRNCSGPDNDLGPGELQDLGRIQSPRCLEGTKLRISLRIGIATPVPRNGPAWLSLPRKGWKLFSFPKK